MIARNILFLSYWSLREPLTAAAVFPYLKLLAEREDVREIHLVTMETTSNHLPLVDLDIPKVILHQVKPVAQRFFVLSKVLLHLSAVHLILTLVRKRKIDLIFAKASMAGAIAQIIHQLTRTPYIVESFEPHSTYMLECGVWKKNGLRYRFSHWMEGVQLKHARHIITVTHNHRDDLIAAGQPAEQVRVIPSITDLFIFRHQPAERQRIRSELGIPMSATVGIYVGKFGGLYLDEEAFTIFARSFHFFEDLYIIILSPTDREEIIRKAQDAGIDIQKIRVLIATHIDVPHYLSAADMAFSTIKPSPIKRYQCPIKNGEYWASGLPILMTDGISDEYKLLRQGIGGCTFSGDLHDLDQALVTIQSILGDPAHRTTIAGLARDYKSIDLARQVYASIL